MIPPPSLGLLSLTKSDGVRPQGPHCRQGAKPRFHGDVRGDDPVLSGVV